MARFSALCVLLPAFWLALPGRAQEIHLNEAGSGPVLSRSAFAHGYRHGYEEGYHQGNVDINMGREPRSQRKAQFRGVKLKPDYAPSFGSKRSFDEGFDAGLKAGYVDGYYGRAFRAVELLRLVAVEVDRAPPPEDPGSIYFDQGLAGGYHDGWQQGSSTTGAEKLDFHGVPCSPPHSEKRQDLAAHGSYCEGYRRGYVLGLNDILALRSNVFFLEASK